MEAIRDAPPPTHVTELKAFLGLLSYYRKFLPNLSSVLEPLYELLQKKRLVLGNKTDESIFGSETEAVAV